MGPVKPGPSDKTATPAHVGGVSKVRRDSSASIHNITQLCNDLTISSPRVGRIKNRNLPRGTRSISSYFSPTRARQASSNNQASNQPVQADNAQCNVDTQSSQPAPAPTAELSKNCVAEVARQVPGTQVLTPATERAPRVDKTAPRRSPARGRRSGASAAEIPSRNVRSIPTTTPTIPTIPRPLKESKHNTLVTTAKRRHVISRNDMAQRATNFRARAWREGGLLLLPTLVAKKLFGQQTPMLSRRMD